MTDLMSEVGLRPVGHLGLRIIVADAWVTRTEWRWVRFVQPPVPPRGKRKGTRRQWKRAHPQGLRWRPLQIEVDDHPIMRTPDTLIMTARTKRLLDARLAESRP
jgi:hypothetical protein